MDLTPIYNEIYRVYDNLNKKFYDSKLPPVIITIQSEKAGTGKTFGWVRKDGWIDINDKTYYELNISAEYLNRDVYDLFSTLNHEMVHIYCWENDIQDTSNNNRYHNKRFKNEAEKRGLVITKAPIIGFSVTSPSDKFKEYLDSLEIKDVFKINRYKPLMAADGDLDDRSKKRKKRPVYECPNCGNIVRGSAGLHILCADCDCEFEYKTFQTEDGAE